MCAAVCAVNSFYVVHVMVIIVIRMINVLNKDYSLFNRRDWAQRFGYEKTAFALDGWGVGGMELLFAAVYLPGFCGRSKFGRYQIAL